MGQLFALFEAPRFSTSAAPYMHSSFVLLSCTFIFAPAYLIPPIPMPVGGPLQVMPEGRYGNIQKRACPMSPYATYLSEQEQQTLAELVTEARGQGADEPSVQQHIMKYVGTVLTPQRFEEFKQANQQFEQQRRGKPKQKPQKIFDFLDEYNGHRSENDFAKMYEENTRKLRLH